ncbi:MAG: type II toxin-antitoxin system HicA family toxin [Gemmatimonadetes bacterium]|nr:type II toxin-antitoxin system HicA family toxin [Gemmatimonadota bacterium]
MGEDYYRWLTGRLTALGYTWVSTGKHQKWKHGTTGASVAVPRPVKTLVTAKSILQQAKERSQPKG